MLPTNHPESPGQFSVDDVHNLCPCQDPRDCLPKEQAPHLQALQHSHPKEKSSHDPRAFCATLHWGPPLLPGHNQTDFPFSKNRPGSFRAGFFILPHLFTFCLVPALKRDLFGADTSMPASLKETAAGTGHTLQDMTSWAVPYERRPTKANGHHCCTIFIGFSLTKSGGSVMAK